MYNLSQSRIYSSEFLLVKRMRGKSDLFFRSEERKTTFCDEPRFGFEDNFRAIVAAQPILL